MSRPGGEAQEIRQIARYQLRPEALEKSLAKIRKSVDYFRAHQPGTLSHEVWREKNEPTRFVHIFVFRDADADCIHSESHEVKEFGVLYPECFSARSVHRLRTGRLKRRTVNVADRRFP